MQLINFVIAGLFALAGSAMAAPTTGHVHTRSLIMARDILDGIIESRSLEIRAWTRAQEAQLVAAAARLTAVNARRGNEANMTDAEKAQLRADLIAAQKEHARLIKLKSS